MIKIEEKSCDICGICTEICPNFVFIQKNNTIIALNPDLCCHCGHCVLYCPQNAIRHENISEHQIVQKSDLNIRPEDIEPLIMARRSNRCFKPDAVSTDLGKHGLNKNAECLVM